MEREKTKRWLERQLISDPGSVEDKRSVCVDRGEREDGGERRKSMCLTHILPRPFILFHRVRSVSNQKAGAPFGSARPFFLFFFFPFLFSFFLLPPFTSLFLHDSTPFMHRCADKRTGRARVHAKTRGTIARGDTR